MNMTLTREQIVNNIQAARIAYGELGNSGLISIENGTVHCRDIDVFRVLAQGAPVRAEWANNRLYLYADSTEGFNLVFLP